MSKTKIRFTISHFYHNHIYGETQSTLDAGTEAVCFFKPEENLAAQFSTAYPQIPRVQTHGEILENESVQLVLNAGIPVERASMGIKVMHHGKDFMVNIPGMPTQNQLESVTKVQVETGRIYSICYSERFWSRAATKEDKLIRAGAIGELIQTLSLRPHQRNLPKKPDSFFVKENLAAS